MYIVRDKKTKEIIHANPAPLSQRLKGKDIYFKFDPKTMEIGKTDGRLPEHYIIDKKGNILELNPEEKIKKGIIKLKPGQKVKHNKIVEKTLSEKANEGLLELLPTQKITGAGENERIVEKTLSEKVKEGLIELSPNQKISGKGEDEKIVETSRQEQLDEGIITREEIMEDHIQRLRNEIDIFLSRHKTKNGYRLDQLTRQKAGFSYQFKHLPGADENKKNLLKNRMIYPDHILDEIIAEIAKVQAAYDAAKKEVIKAHKNKKPLSVFESITIAGSFQAKA
jgi:hypothetical protein